MKNIFKNIFTYGDTVKFQSQLPVEEAISRLSDKTKVQGLMILVGATVSRSTLVGQVAIDRVWLHRVIPFVANMYRPHFNGRFMKNNNGAVLEGDFIVHPLSKIFTLAMLSFFTIAEVLVVLAILGGQHRMYFALFPIGLILLNLILIWFSRWLCRNDVAWISDRIKEVLQ